MFLVQDLRIGHECWGSNVDPSIKGHLHYPNDLDRSLNETVVDKYERTVKTIIIVPLTISPLCLPLLVRLGVYIVNLWVFYFYNLIGKLTSFLNLQEFNFRNLPESSSTTTVRRSPHTSNPRLSTFSPTLSLGVPVPPLIWDVFYLTLPLSFNNKQQHQDWFLFRSLCDHMTNWSINFSFLTQNFLKQDTWKPSVVTCLTRRRRVTRENPPSNLRVV